MHDDQQQIAEPTGAQPEASMPLSTLAPFMAKLPFVMWDRYTNGTGWVNAYGWIPRDDGRADFVLLHMYDIWQEPSLWTSSPRSAEMAALMYGTASYHVDCKRVEDAGLALPNVIRLPKEA